MLREWLKWQCYVFILYVGMEICERDGDGDGDDDEKRARSGSNPPMARACAESVATSLCSPIIQSEKSASDDDT